MFTSSHTTNYDLCCQSVVFQIFLLAQSPEQEHYSIMKDSKILDHREAYSPFTTLCIDLTSGFIERMNFVFRLSEDFWSLIPASRFFVTGKQLDGSMSLVTDLSSSTVPKIQDIVTLFLQNTEKSTIPGETMKEKSVTVLQLSSSQDTQESMQPEVEISTTENLIPQEDQLEDVFWTWDLERERFVHFDEATGKEIVCPQWFD
ncbi:hypothetical protein QC764_0068660 [Podospora pseudoanserina]|uniref:Uncharacterized protein n=1 Tax=Podospora pseudoanserina TaxID=2609844 RepID=A0ABR0IA42_9PEZI|nr:hypothetical protein QC764_0068660 [Podospora pseudoanserina]